jgi:hypothetical protein
MLTKLTVQMPDAATAVALAAAGDHVTEHGVNRESGQYELTIELGAAYDSHAELGRELASVLLSIHRWFEELDVRSVDVLLASRRFTIQPPDD